MRSHRLHRWAQMRQRITRFQRSLASLKFNSIARRRPVNGEIADIFICVHLCNLWRMLAVPRQSIFLRLAAACPPVKSEHFYPR